MAAKVRGCHAAAATAAGRPATAHVTARGVGQIRAAHKALPRLPKGVWVCLSGVVSGGEGPMVVGALLAGRRDVEKLLRPKSAG